MFSDSSSLFGKLNRLSSICLNDTIPRRHLGFKLLQGKSFIFLSFFSFFFFLRGQGKTKQTKPKSLVLHSDHQFERSHHSFTWCKFFPDILALWGFGYLMVPAVHVLLAFSLVKHIPQYKCWKNCNTLGVIFGASVVPSITMYSYYVVNNNYFELG